MLSDGRIRWLAEVALRSFVTVAVVETAIRAAVAEAVAAEREACALVFDGPQSSWGYSAAAAAVRARGEEEQ